MASNTNKILAILIAMIMVCSLMVSPTNANPSLSYGAIGKDEDAKCSDGHCKTLEDPANGYNRGCEPENDCRS
ncbi:protein RALF-like 7 [Cucumis melo var. makuwa]|uniref:Protein RALF-like 7 n=1 Tax=Cucumis melo var. makuwa TaxID=1194695 RepID=A0A5A7UUI8_CUCMM|nr:protein RALF-like 7 [Cucumis melo var. makuwa]TYK10516.1 protein RALF-like 7 [Cucumis melo var. makuwa]